MNAPGFTAETSLYRTSIRYSFCPVHKSMGIPIAGMNQNASGSAEASMRLLPQLYDFYKVTGLPNPRILIVRPSSCDLACGQDRDDCYRTGRSPEQCDQEWNQCWWDCTFFSRA
jgi:hypothetical protein